MDIGHEMCVEQIFYRLHSLGKKVFAGVLIVYEQFCCDIEQCMRLHVCVCVREKDKLHTLMPTHFSHVHNVIVRLLRIFDKQNCSFGVR